MRGNPIDNLLTGTKEIISNLEELISSMADDPNIDASSIADFENMLDDLRTNYEEAMANKAKN